MSHTIDGFVSSMTCVPFVFPLGGLAVGAGDEELDVCGTEATEPLELELEKTVELETEDIPFSNEQQALQRRYL